MTTFPVPLSGQEDTTLLWANEYEIEPTALQQLRDIGKLPFIHGLRVMPDVHFGKGATVGSVIAMKDALSPAAVGVDLGCGVIAVKTSLKYEDLVALPRLRNSIEKAIPVGFNAHDDVVNVRKLDTKLEAGYADFWKRYDALHADTSWADKKVRKQLGTLGGGNHFIELCKDQNGDIWLTLHSGSRNIGKVIAEQHIEKAKTMEHNSAFGDLAVFMAGTAEMDAYRRDLEWAQEYAARSRDIMLALFERVVFDHFAYNGITVTFGERYNAHHNYVADEVIDGERLIVTRKGAIRAGSGDMALIPGSMGTGSYIVRGLGNPESFYSASHGAGRKMSRSKAKKMFTVEDLIEQTSGVESRKDAGIVDEIPGAYKSIESVIEAQSNLVEVVQKLDTLLCVKG